MKIRIFVALCLAFISSEAMAWSAQTHNTIGHIAEQHLTTEAKQKCHHYLRHTLAYYAVWQDDVAFSKEYAESRFWHGVRYDAKNRYQYRNGQNAITQIMRIYDQMKEGGYKKLTDSAIIVNLKFLIHMVGDMHCPSHNYYDDDPNPKYKRFSILDKGKKVHWHRFWDRSAGYLHRGWNCQDFAKNIDNLSDKEIAKICKGSVEQWAKQNGKEMREPYTLLVRHTELKSMPEENIKRMTELVDMQILRGAYRLAYIINDIFKY
jgi:hypothetical protein